MTRTHGELPDIPRKSKVAAKAGYQPLNVIRIAARAAEVSYDRFASQSNRHSQWIVEWRAACAWILRHRLGMKFEHIAARLGCHHSTVQHYLATICTQPHVVDRIGSLLDMLDRNLAA